jgi:vancomycin resistance protein YoaR
MTSLLHPVRASRLVPLLVLAVFLVAVGAYRVSLEVAYADRIYPGVHAAGLDLGGLTVEQAANRLQSRFATYEGQTITIQAGDQTMISTPTALGFKPDPLALADASYAVGRRNDLLSYVAGPLVTHPVALPILANALIDDATLARAVGAFAVQTDRPPVNAELSLTPAVELKPSRTGQILDQAQSQAVVERYLVDSRSDSLVLPVTTSDAKITTADLAPIQVQAVKILAQPVELTDGQQRWPVSSVLLRSALSLQTDPVALELATDSLAGPVQEIAQAINRPARNATMTIAHGQVTLASDAPGQEVDVTATLSALHDRVLAAATTVPLAIRTVEPSLKASDLRPTAAEAQNLIDRGLLLTAGDQKYPLTPTQLGDLLAVTPDASGRWSVLLDPAKVTTVIHTLNQRFEHPSIDARFGWENGKLKLIQSQVPADAIDEAAALEAILGKWRNGKVDLPVVHTAMPVDDALLARLSEDLTATLQEREISFAGSIPERAHNIALALSRINGTYVPPGATFSFNRAVGPTTLAAGFQWGFGFSTEAGGSSQVVPSVAGGICQVATTVFQPVFWAGYQIEERHWHMFAMHHYAVNGYLGLDATVSPDDGVDLQFTNDSNHALLILADTKDQSTHVALVGTKPDWTVKVDPEQITNVVPAPAGVERSTSPLFARGREIILEEAGQGLTAHVVRHVVYPDGHERTLKLTSDYLPAQQSVLVGTGDPTKPG